MGVLEAVPTQFPEVRGAESTRDTGLLTLRKGHVFLVLFFISPRKRSIGARMGVWMAKACFQLLGYPGFKKLSWRVAASSDTFSPKRQCQSLPRSKATVARNTSSKLRRRDI